MLKTDSGRGKARPKICILEDDKLCDDCCECYVCDLDPKKICDSCGKCLETADYRGIIVDGMVLEEERATRVWKRGEQYRGRCFRFVRKERGT